MNHYSFESDVNWYQEEPEEAYYVESDDEYNDYDNDFFGEASATVRGFRGVKPPTAAKPKGVVGVPMKPAPPPAYRGSGVVNTPAGQAKVNLPPDLVSQKEFKALEEKVLANNKAILANGKAINALTQNTKSLELAYSRNSANVQKKFAAIQQGQMISAFLQPKLTKLKFQGETERTVETSAFDSTSALLPMLLMGGFGGDKDGDSGSGMNNMMLPLMMIALNDKDNSGSDNTMMFLALTMM